MLPRNKTPPPFTAARHTGHRLSHGTTQLASQMDRIEQTVNNLTTKLDVVIEQGASNETHLHDLKSELQHYGTLMTGLTKHLKDNQTRLGLLFWGLGFLCVGLLFWLIAALTRGTN